MVPQRFSIVASRPHETASLTAYWGCLRYGSWASAWSASSWSSVDGWPLATPETEHREATTRYGHRNGRSSVLGPPPGAATPPTAGSVRRKEALGNLEGKADCRLGVSGPARSAVNGASSVSPP
ncbi:hypothetical protein SNK04_013843, partial [Fusarium graminearum]